jgi:hypothetical protein
VNHARARDLHLDPVIDPFALDVHHGAPLDAADHHPGLGIIELRAVFVGANVFQYRSGEQFRVGHCLSWQAKVLALRLSASEEVPHVRCARAQLHHSSSDGNLTSQLFSPPERIGTTSSFAASKTGFIVSSIRVLLTGRYGQWCSESRH